jgi:ATP-dependent Clp protease adaptor protein ClpS
MITGLHFDKEELEDVMVMDEDVIGQKSFLILYNDDHNSFDWVIQCLMEVCDHTHVQSEQLSLIIHFKGKATVKTGTMEVLQPMKDTLIERGLSAVIETELQGKS